MPVKESKFKIVYTLDERGLYILGETFVTVLCDGNPAIDFSSAIYKGLEVLPPRAVIVVVTNLSSI